MLCVHFSRASPLGKHRASQALLHGRMGREGTCTLCRRPQDLELTLSVVWSVSKPMESVLAPTIFPSSHTSCWMKRSVESPISRIGTRLPGWDEFELRSWSASGCSLQRASNSFQSCLMPTG